MKQTETAIAVKSLVKSFKGVKVLKGIDFTVKKGDIFALLGSNGAGKTTTVKILATLLNPDRGSAEIYGYNTIKNARQVREQISLTGQYAAVDENLTGRENLRMIASLRHLPKSEDKSNELLRQFDLADAANRRVLTYSGGMRRKLDLAMSLIGNPSVIFLDEPTTGLDPQSRLSMWKIIRQLAASGKTIYLTTQYLEEAEQLADYVAILNNGIIAAEGSPGELKKMLPSGVTELAFYDETEFQKACEILKDYELRPSNETLTLLVTIGNDIEPLVDILNTLKDNMISISGFSQKLPTLEDVYFSLIGENAEKETGKND